MTTRIAATIARAGHRERKKQRTREQIVESAFALFRDGGFQATTVADIAAAADIAPRTFFAYFPSKEAAVFYDFDGLFESLQGAIVDRPEGVTAIDDEQADKAHSMALLDEALVFLRGGVAALQDRG